MEREGKVLKVLKSGHQRRMADGKNAWRKMDDTQRLQFLGWMCGGDEKHDAVECDELVSIALDGLGSGLEKADMS